ncbi:MAG: mechanosensitive ion channel [Clostridiales bacterium]|nr:mechanosensitive ion channel [Clostridiales bacterium]
MENLKERLLDFLLNMGPKLIGAALVALIGLWLTKILVKILDRPMTRMNLDYSLKRFLLICVRTVCILVVVISAMSTLGISSAGLLAALGGAAVAVSLALKDSLSNMAGSIMLLFSHPFVTGDFIEAGGLSGTVQRIDMVHTYLNTPDNRQIVIPNGQLISQSIVNYSREDKRRVDMTFSIGYTDDVETAKAALRQVIEKHPMALREPAPFIRVEKRAASSVDLIVRVWCKNADYWDLRFDLLEQGGGALDQAGVNTPYDQLDVHLVDGQKKGA